TGALIVTTPQNVALADVRKAADMFKNESINVPLLGVIENMSYFAPEDCPGKKYHIFGQGGGQIVANELDSELIGSIPIVEAIAETGDSGVPIALDDSTASAGIFKEIAEKLIFNVNKRNTEQEATRIVQIDPNANCSTE
ncbi:MAG: P-loop NTPase, partial [Bacteroidales bacterium]|nr:P-loop NTPase [Bacteroidales bacterium]